MSEKEKTREKIVSIARDEFLKKGFHDASVRRIAKGAGVTTGSFYWHFKDKHALFDAIVREHYEHIMKMYQEALDRFFEMPKEEQKDHMGDIGGVCMIEMLEYIYLHKPEFEILIKGSAGTRYENLLHELTEAEIQSTNKFLLHMKDLGIENREITPELEHIVVRGMFEGLLELVAHDLPLERARKCVHELHGFYTAGWHYLLNIVNE